MEAVLKKCVNCHKNFYDSSYNLFAKYCSSDCRKKNYIRGKRVESECDRCGNKYLRRFSHQRFCSLECSKAQQRDQLHDRRGHPWYKLRFEIMQRDNFTCRYCGRNVIDDGIKIVVDHLDPKNNGGKDRLENYITACLECNGGKADFCLTQAQKVKFKDRPQVNKN